MKKLLAFLLITSIFACKNIEQYKAGITELGTKWEATSAAVGEFATMLDASKAAHMANLDSLKIDSSFLAKVKKTDVAAVTAALQAYNDSGAGFEAVSAQLNELKGTWSAKGEEVKALQDGLAAGKLDGDVTAKIAELNNYITTSETAVAGMKETVNKTSEASKSAYDALKASVSAYMKK